MTNQEIKDNIAKVDAAIASPTTPEALIPKLEAKKKEFEKALSDLESAAAEEKKIEQKEKTVEKAKPVTIPQVKKVAAVKKEIQKEKPLVVEKKTKARKSAKDAAAEVKDILSGMSANVKDFNKGRSQADIARDAAKVANKPGKHISSTGKTYYESRPDHTDINPKKHLAKGGGVDGVLYDVVWTTDNQISSANLTEQELIEFADTLVYYDTMDEAEEGGREQITTLDAAIKAIEHGNDYKVVKKENSFAKGGKIVKLSKEERATLLKATMYLSAYKRQFKQSQVGYTQTNEIIEKFSTSPLDNENIQLAILTLKNIKEGKADQQQKDAVQKVIDELARIEGFADGGKIYANGGQTGSKEVKKWAYDQLEAAGVDLEVFKHKVAQLKMDLHYGNVGEDDYSGWETTKNELDEMIDQAELGNDIYYDNETGQISEYEPEYQEDDNSEWHVVNVKQVLFGELSQYFAAGGKVPYRIPYDLPVFNFNYEIEVDGKTHNVKIYGAERNTSDDYSFSQFDGNRNSALMPILVKNTAIRKLANGQRVTVTVGPDKKNGYITKKERIEGFAAGGEIQSRFKYGFTVAEMKQFLDTELPDSFRFEVYAAKEGARSQEVKPEMKTSDGLKDNQIKEKLFFGDVRERGFAYHVFQSGENTYFYFALFTKKYDNYVGRFGFKDQGDVSPEYINKFVALLHEFAGIPFQVNHSVYADGGRTKAAINKDRKYINQAQSWETDYDRKQPGRHYMAGGGEIPAHFGNGTNITVFGYETKNFVNCPRAVEEIVKARNYITAETSGTKYEEQSEGLKKLTQTVDNILGIEKECIAKGTATEKDIEHLVLQISFFGVYNLMAGNIVDASNFIAVHVIAIAMLMGNKSFSKGGKTRKHAGNANAWYNEAVEYLKKTYHIEPNDIGISQDAANVDAAFNNNESPSEFIDDLADKYDLDKFSYGPYGLANGGRTTAAINKDRKFINQSQPWEVNRIRKTPGRSYMAFGGMVKHVEKNMQKLAMHYLPEITKDDVADVFELTQPGEYKVDKDTAGDGSKTYIVELYCGDYYPKVEKRAESEGYEKFAAFAEIVAKEKNANVEISWGNNDNCLTFTFSDLSGDAGRGNYEQGGKIKAGAKKVIENSGNAMAVFCSSIGNPDWDQNPNAPISPEKFYAVNNLKEAAAKCKQYIADYDLGGGNWTGGQVYCKDGKIVAEISYNGRAWHPGPYSPDRKEFTGEDMNVSIFCDGGNVMATGGKIGIEVQRVISALSQFNTPLDKYIGKKVKFINAGDKQLGQISNETFEIRHVQRLYNNNLGFNLIAITDDFLQKQAKKDGEIYEPGSYLKSSANNFGKAASVDKLYLVEDNGTKSKKQFTEKDKNLKVGEYDNGGNIKAGGGVESANKPGNQFDVNFGTKKDGMATITWPTEGLAIEYAKAIMTADKDLFVSIEDDKDNVYILGPDFKKINSLKDIKKMASGGRTKAAFNNDHNHLSQEPHELEYVRQTGSKRHVYKKDAGGDVTEEKFPLIEQRRLIAIAMSNPGKKDAVIKELEEYRDSYAETSAKNSNAKLFGQSYHWYKIEYQKAIDFVKKYKQPVPKLKKTIKKK